MMNVKFWVLKDGMVVRDRVWYSILNFGVIIHRPTRVILNNP